MVYRKIFVAIVHGIGKPVPGYAAPLIKGLRAQFNSLVQETLKTKDDYSGQVEFREIIWDGVLAENQDKLAALLKKGFEKHATRGVRALFSKLFSFLTRPIFQLRTTFAAQAVSDIIGYKNKDAYPQIHRCLALALDQFSFPPSIVEQKESLSFISHSLGTVITSDFIYDRQKKFGNVSEKFVLENFFTLGSPIALFALQYGVELFKSPIRLESEVGQWINIFDLDDPVAYPLKNLNSVYNQAVSDDCEVNTGGFGVSHTRYFANRIIQRLIAERLAGDWLRLNGHSHSS